MDTLMYPMLPAGRESPNLRAMHAASDLTAWVERRDEAAFERLVHQLADLVVRTCRRLLGDRTAADEAAQAVFIILGRRARVVTGADRLGPWLYGVAIGVCRNARRTAERRRRHEQEAAMRSAHVASIAAEPSWVDVRPQLDEALASLSGDQRDVVIGYFLMDKSDPAQPMLSACRSPIKTSRFARESPDNWASLAIHEQKNRCSRC